ncbi:sugar ABC transporter permease [Microbacterium trichothecenolyticum]|uniref:Sugar ABC transporter permease n=1 Tax=Microbacterium ureisolvens TaxID=2781186 RepID=A0ABS7I2P1_9MICO|nr:MULTISPECIES: sugar ABC transporter permease [Microbacterium]MBW9111906.1 sugar ABC transporter permease [Microbacterium ureisolvens]MBW9122247.1 sugar ABC transporter permease [Microbacterium trichothecenolyticum]
MTLLRTSRLRPTVAPWLFLAPAIVLSAGLLLAPLVYTVVLSLQGRRVPASGIGVATDAFVGFDNYLRTLTNPALLASFGRMVILALIAVPLTMGLALLFALLLDHLSSRFTRFSRISIFIPYAVPGVIAALMWGFMYLPGVSPVGELFTAFGLPVPDPLEGPSVFFAVANVCIWGAIGFNMVILYTSLRGLPQEIYDSARLDGCSEAQLALKIKLPLILPGVILTGLFTIIGALQIFSEPNMMMTLTNSITSDWVPMMLVYRDAFVTNDLYGASATAIVITVITMVASLGLLRLLRTRAFGGES